MEHDKKPNSSNGVHCTNNGVKFLHARSSEETTTVDILQHATAHVTTNSAAGLWMLVDGIGLALITACTILEAFDMWKDYYKGHWLSNSFPLMIWFGGKIAQVLGLLFLLLHAASFQIFPEVERFGMLMLTIGPTLNIISCLLFNPASDPYYLFNKRWLTSEVLELLGISILDVSLIDMEEKVVLAFEIVGFLVLCCAAVLDFEYPSPYPFEEGDSLSMFPKIGLRLDLVYTNECGGLILLIIVALGQYQIKVHKHAQHHLHQQQHHHHHYAPLLHHHEQDEKDRSHTHTVHSSLQKLPHHTVDEGHVHAV
mmetsp:Transcript_13703/g.18762  ORF Transcript_13703/g.18762 Transcript_13703/m.18762 type:complete len:311 (+) Transcript_13703:55-987(+)